MANWLYDSCKILTPAVDLTETELHYIAAGSAIVAHERAGAMIIYYEGNLINAMNLHSINERIYSAAGRLLTRYPTVALSSVTPERSAELFHTVGTVSVLQNKMKIDVTDDDKLNIWANSYVERA